ncbi:MAG: hypothetical protein KBG29_01930 [Pseudomonadales bacterium]|nr:hypothetical protein [Pseudomonadales bacterium]
MNDPFGWITEEAVYRMAAGGNGSRGTVPVHAKPSAVSYVPLYRSPQPAITDKQLLTALRVMTDRAAHYMAQRTGVPMLEWVGVEKARELIARCGEKPL